MSDDTTFQTIDLIAIGGSAGALDALGLIVRALPADFAIPVVVVLHLPATKPSLVASVLGARCALPAREPDDKEPIEPGVLYVAPPNYHLLVERQRSFSLSVDAVVLFSRPSIDVLFESAADACGSAVLGVLLSGANEDGARGLARIKASGGFTVVQSPETADVPAMPEAALRLMPADRVLPPVEIGPFLASLHGRGQEGEARR